MPLYKIPIPFKSQYFNACVILTHIHCGWNYRHTHI